MDKDGYDLQRAAMAGVVADNRQHADTTPARRYDPGFAKASYATGAFQATGFGDSHKAAEQAFDAKRATSDLRSGDIAAIVASQQQRSRTALGERTAARQRAVQREGRVLIGQQRAVARKGHGASSGKRRGGKTWGSQCVLRGRPHH